MWKSISLSTLAWRMLMLSAGKCCVRIPSPIASGKAISMSSKWDSPSSPV